MVRGCVHVLHHRTSLSVLFLPQMTTHQPSMTITVPPPSPSAPAPESSLAAPFPLCLQLANQCPTFRLRCPTLANHSLRCRWRRSVRRVPNRPAGRGLACAAPAASARLSALSTGTRNRSSSRPALESERLPSSRRTAAKKPPTAGSQLACPFRRRFSQWYVEKVMLVLCDTATMVPLIKYGVNQLDCPKRVWDDLSHAHHCHIRAYSPFFEFHPST